MTTADSRKPNTDEKVDLSTRFIALCSITFALISTAIPARSANFYFSSNLSATNRIPYAQDSGAYLMGYRSDLGAFSETQCLQLKAGASKQTQQSTAQVGHLFVDTGSSMEDFVSKSSTHAAASFGIGAYSGSAEYNAIKSKSISTYTEYLRTTFDVEKSSTKYELSDLELNDTGKSAIVSNTFFQQCGDQFVIGQIAGGKIDILFQASVKSASEQNDVKSSLSANYKSISGGASANASYFESLAKSLTQKGATYEILRKGPNDAMPSGNIKDLLDYTSSLPEKLNDKAWPTDWIVSSYANFLPQGYKEASTKDFTYELLVDHAKLSRALAGLVSAFDYMTIHPDEFGSIDLNILKSVRSQVNDTFLLHSRTVKKCIGEWTADCEILKSDYPTSQVIANLQPPLRPREIKVSIPDNYYGAFLETQISQPYVVEIVGSISNGAIKFDPSSGIYWISVYDRTSNVRVGYFQYSGPFLTLPNRRVEFKTFFGGNPTDPKVKDMMCDPKVASFPSNYKGESNARIITYALMPWVTNLKSDTDQTPICQIH